MANTQNKMKDKEKTARKNTKSGKWKKVRTAILIALTVILVLILALAATATIMLKRLHGIAYENNKPVVNTGDYSADIENPPNIIEDNITGYITDDNWETIPPEDPEPSDTSSNSGNSGSNSTSNTEPKETAAPNASNPSSSPSTETKYPMPENYVGSIPIYKVDQINSNIQNFLLVGRDAGSYYGRADSAMVVSYNTKTGDVAIVSLLRDSYVPIEGHDWNKLGHALSYGGMGLYINTVNYVFNLDIQQYAVVDFEGVVEIIDQMGGIEVSLTQAEVDYYKKTMNYDFVVGVNHLDGTQALRHCRNRSLSGTDFERTRRQRDVLMAMYNKVMKLGYGDAMDIIENALGYVRTNVPFTKCISLASSILKNGLNSIKSTQAPFDGTWTYAYVRPEGYTGNMAVTKMDISKNRKRFREYLYG